MVGEAPWCAAMEVNIGAAGFFAPPERRFPADGVLALGKLNEAQWVCCDLDLDLTDEARKDGDVLNARNWDLQPGAAAVPGAKVVTLE